MKTHILFIILCLYFCSINGIVNGQPPISPVNVVVSSDRGNEQYQKGDSVLFSVRIFDNNQLIKDDSFEYEYAPEQENVWVNGVAKLKDGICRLKFKGMDRPGFMRLKVRYEKLGNKYTGLSTIGFSVSEIHPTVELPEDFSGFWARILADNSKEPLEPKMDYIQEMSDDSVAVYHVRLRHMRKGGYLYGWLAMPQKEGKYPAILKLPGAGVWKHAPDIQTAKQGAIVFTIGIHGIPLTLDASVYEEMRTGCLWRYWDYAMDDKNYYYFKRPYAGCIRAIDFLCTLTQYDGNLGVYGNSQGGALTLVTAGLDKRVKAFVAIHPALCDLTGYLNGRAGGWPHMFKHGNIDDPVIRQRRNELRYYDAVNFARGIQAKGLLTWGLNDETCPPTSFYSAMNVIPVNTETLVYPQTGHWMFAEQQEKCHRWLLSALRKR